MLLEEAIKQNPSLKLLGKSKLKQKLDGLGISNKEIDEYFSPKEINQLYAQPKKYKPLKITAPPFSFQMDVALLPAYKKQNKGKDQFLILVDILSRKAFAYVLKSGKMKHVLAVYEEFIKETGCEVNSVAGDNFFNNAEFLLLNKELYIDVYTDVAKEDHIVKGKGDKLGIVDRCIRTIKKYIQKYMLIHDDFKWTRYLDKIIELYNDTPNQGIDNNTPHEVFDDYPYMIGLYKGQKKYNQEVNNSFGLEPGDRVRAVVGKGTFEKEKARFSQDIYTIKEQVGYKFVLIDETGGTVKRKYRANELLKIGEVTDRLGKEKEKAEQEHRKIKKTRKATGKSYSETIEDVALALAYGTNRDEPRQKRKSTPSNRVACRMSHVTCHMSH